jgi:hypothetical protein
MHSRTNFSLMRYLMGASLIEKSGQRGVKTISSRFGVLAVLYRVLSRGPDIVSYEK